jgi:hypothetical protein
MSDDSTTPVAHTRYGDLSLDQIAEIQPGMARLMVEISDRFWILYYAAKAGNWEMARHEYSEMRKTLQIAGLTRPKYQEPIEGFAAEKLKPLEAAVRAKDWSAFETAFHEAAGAANEMHGEFGYQYIQWQLPDTPPPHLKL